ncbi:MAG TPA: ribonuclease HI [Firmicutes bacterium]|nr:ribonuclease HI [Bacillota bacterium]
MKPEVAIYTDGACSGNPGPGGWGAVLLFGGHEKEISGSAAKTTNQRMEMYAAVRALRELKRPCRVKLYSDSAYLINAFTLGWLENWQRNGWLNARKDPVKNKDLWQKLLELSQKHEIEWIKVKGHSDDELNNRCDALARQAIQASGNGVGSCR